MKKIFVAGAVIAAFGIAFTATHATKYVYAQTASVASTTEHPKIIKAILIANVSLYSPSLVKVTDNDYRISFTLYNGGETQGDVRYIASILDEKQKVVSTQLFEKIIMIEKGKSAFISEKLLIPKGLNGTYTVQVQASTIGGLPLGFGTAGKFTVNEQTDASLSNCTLNQKTFIQKDTIMLTCSVSGNKTYSVGTRIFHGNEIKEMETVESPIVNGKAVLTISTPKQAGPYVVRTSLYDNGYPVGEEKINSFAVNGTSVSILNLLLSKDAFAKGEYATSTVSLSVFSNEANKLHLELMLSGKDVACGDRIFQPLTQRLAFEIPILVTHICKNPNLTVRVADEAGTLYAEKSLSLVSRESSTELGSKLGYGLVIALVFLALLSFVRSTKPKKRSSKK